MKGNVNRRKTSLSTLLIIVTGLSLLVPCFFINTVAATGTTYYVSSSGSDSNTGTLANPWRTIQKAANTVTQGDTVYIRGGTYHEKITLHDLQGTTNAWVTFSRYNSETVIIDATGMSGTYDGIFLFQDGCSYIRITGLEIRSTANHGIFLYGGEINNIRIDHCTIHDCESSAIYSTRPGDQTTSSVTRNTSGTSNSTTTPSMTSTTESATALHPGAPRRRSRFPMSKDLTSIITPLLPMVKKASI